MLKLRNMIQNKYFNFSTVIFLLTGSFAWSQFVEVNAELDMRRLREGDRHLFDTMAEDIENRILERIVSEKCNKIFNIYLNKEETENHTCGKKYLNFFSNCRLVTRSRSCILTFTSSFISIIHSGIRS